MNSVAKNQPLSERTVLIAPSVTGELATELERLGARVLTWPTPGPAKPESLAPVDEAIEHLFGYDWIIFRNFNAADFFLRRFQELGRDPSELDALRVCAIGEATTKRLDEAQIHIDVNPDELSSEAAFAAIETYVGGRDSLGGLNFLIPRAAISRDFLARTIEEAEARVDEVTAYRTCSANSADLAQIKGLLTGGGIDCVAFARPSEVLEFAAVFDTNDLHRLVDGVAVACIDESTANTAGEFGVDVDITSSESTIPALAREITAHFGSSRQ
jgi:uroporphyrinogen III methyltransferase/synthase